ncbi:MAG: glycerol dehydrogenase [Thermoleophilia bacterium]|nr:glycerol dehydrogenase [Thermoleophilia bacterium]
MAAFDPRTDYPLGTRRPELVTTPAGVPLDRVDLAALREGRIGAADLRASGETLGRQAAIAAASGREQLAASLARAAELAAVPDEVILGVYTALRPRRATAGELEAWAERLEREHDAPAAAAFVREARAAYAARDLLLPEPETS